MTEQVAAHCVYCGVRRQRIGGVYVCGHCDRTPHPPLGCRPCTRMFPPAYLTILLLPPDQR